MSSNTVPLPCPADISSPFTHRCRYTAILKGGMGVLGDTGLETVLEAAGDVTKVSHAAGANGLSALGLLAPVVCSHSLVPATRTSLASRVFRVQ